MGLIWTTHWLNYPQYEQMCFVLVKEHLVPMCFCNGLLKMDAYGNIVYLCAFKILECLTKHIHNSLKVLYAIIEIVELRKKIYVLTTIL